MYHFYCRPFSYFLNVSVLTSFIFILTSISIAHGQNAEILEDYTSIKIRNGKKSIYKACVIQINKRQGEKYATIRIPFSPESKLKNFEAGLFDAMGNEIRKLKKEEIKERNAYSRYSLYVDDMVKEFSLKHNRYPYTIKYSYNQSFNEFIYAAHWRPVKNLDLPIKSAILEFSAPPDYSFDVCKQNIKEPEIATKSDNKFIRFEYAYEDTIEKEIYQGNLAEYLPEVTIIPEHFKYGIDGELKSWQAFGNYIYRLGAYAQDLPEWEKQMAKRKVENAQSKKQKIEILYKYLQENCRYVNVIEGIGGLQPFPASYVSENKYGDCKALSNYMQALLKAVDIESYYTLIYAGDPKLTVDTSKVVDPFNHIILMVPLEKDTCWIENTSQTITLNYVGTSIQNRLALAIKEKGSEFVRLPKLSMSDVKNERYIKTHISNRKVEIDIAQNLRGGNYEYSNGISNGLNYNEQLNYIDNLIYLKNTEIKSFEIIRNANDSAFNILKAKCTINSTIKLYGNDVFLNSFPIEMPHFENINKRKMDVKIPYPIYTQQQVVYINPNNAYELSDTINYALKTPFGEYIQTCSQYSDSICVEKTFKLFRKHISIDQYAEFYNFVNEAKKQNCNKIHLKK